MTCDGHTDSQVRLAHKLALVFQDDDTDEKAGWFMHDVENVEEPEGDGWVVEKLDDWHDCPVISIQGVLYSLDINEEGNPPIETLAELANRLGDEGI